MSDSNPPPEDPNPDSEPDVDMGKGSFEQSTKARPIPAGADSRPHKVAIPRHEDETPKGR